MNPINALNQEFARLVVEEWNDEASIRHQEQEETETATGFGALWQGLAGWLRGQAQDAQPAQHETLRQH